MKSLYLNNMKLIFIFILFHLKNEERDFLDEIYFVKKKCLYLYIIAFNYII